MPRDLFLVRHGQSEGNVAVKAASDGDTSYVDHPEYQIRHSSWWRLTDLGVEQAKQAGQRLNQEFLNLTYTDADVGWTRTYASAYTRAMETAALLELPNADWFIDPNLRERERGDMDRVSKAEMLEFEKSMNDKKSAPLFWRPPNGESMADVCARIRDFLSTLHREAEGGCVAVVCHGEVIEAFRILLERAHHMDYMDWDQSGDPIYDIHNGQLVHYTRTDPVTGVIHPYLNWYRMIYPASPNRQDTDWFEVKRPRFTNQELLEFARRVDPIDFSS